MKRLIYWLLTMLGFTTVVSCEENDRINVNMYGSPYINYIAKGRIVDNENRPIKNIQFIPAVVLYNNDKSQFKIFPRIDTTYTNERGEYYIIGSNDDGSGNASVGIYLNDIDGTQNGGEFESQQIIFDFSEVKLDTTNRNDWYRGSKTLYQDIVLEKKK